jgi:hypothetical protein
MIDVLRNSIGVIMGLLVALVIIMVGITLDKNWIEYDYIKFPYEHWNRVIKHAARSEDVRNEFFAMLLLSCGIGAMIGGLITAIIVRKAKKAYAVFVGFILFLGALADVIFTPGHPTWYELSIMPVFFFFSWLGGLLTDVVMKKLAHVKL